MRSDDDAGEIRNHTVNVQNGHLLHPQEDMLLIISGWALALGWQPPLLVVLGFVQQDGTLFESCGLGLNWRSIGDGGVVATVRRALWPNPPVGSRFYWYRAATDSWVDFIEMPGLGGHYDAASMADPANRMGARAASGLSGSP